MNSQSRLQKIDGLTIQQLPCAWCCRRLFSRQSTVCTQSGLNAQNGLGNSGFMSLLYQQSINPIDIYKFYKMEIKSLKCGKISFIEAVKSNEDDMKPGLKKPAKENQFWRAHSLNSPDPQLHHHTHLWEPKTERTYIFRWIFV